MQLSDEEKRELAEVYERAADLLVEKGWRQGLNGMGVTYCVGAAIGYVAGNRSPLYVKARDFFLGALELPLTVVCLVNWNDDPYRTVDEVINTLHALANKLR